MNFFDAYLEKENNNVRVSLFGDLSSFIANSKYFSKVPIDYLKGTKKVVVGVRSEHLSFIKNNNYPSFIFYLWWRKGIFKVSEISIIKKVYYKNKIKANRLMKMSEGYIL